ncbi:hypothetical protein F5B17DRAFT_379693 [Nemania serpens]|nr:hypothetical protein F5B17DRAFT_379693 [Nemania serpens]
MSQQRDGRLQDARMSSQTSGDDDDVCSNKAASGSSDPDSEDLDFDHTRSRSSGPGLQRPMTRRLLRDLEAARTIRQDIGSTAQAISSPSSSSLRGLTPPPLPSVMLPGKKRSLDEVLNDDSPPQKDKMSVEIDRLAVGSPNSQLKLAGPSGTQNATRTPSHPPKKSRVGGGPSSPRQLPVVIEDLVTSSDTLRNRPLERRLDGPLDHSHPGSRESSD